MFHRSRLMVAVFSITALCIGIGSSPVFARGGGGGGHGGGGGGHGGHSGGGGHSAGGYHAGGYHNGGHYGGSFYGGGIYRSGLYGGLYNYSNYGNYGGGLYPYSYGSVYNYSMPQNSYYPPIQQVQPQLQPQQNPGPSTDTPSNAQIKVLLPDPQAKVWFDGVLTTSTGTERVYHTPELTAASGNTYRVRAVWNASGKEQAQEQVIQVAPGRGVVVDFTRPFSEPLAPPPAK